MKNSAFEEFIKVLRIDPERIYTLEEISGIVKRKPRTIRGWIDIGLRNGYSGKMIICLECYRIASTPMVLGKHLVEFITKTQKMAD